MNWRSGGHHRGLPATGRPCSNKCGGWPASASWPIAEAAGGTLGTVARRDTRIEKLSDQARGRHFAAGVAVPARESAGRAMSCCTFTKRARRPTPGPAARSSNGSWPAIPSWRSISAGPARRGRPRPATIRPNTRTLHRLHAGPFVRRDAGGRHARLRSLCGRTIAGGRERPSTSSPSATSASPRSMRRLWSQTSSDGKTFAYADFLGEYHSSSSKPESNG